MNAEIARTQRRFIQLYLEQRSYLASKPPQFLADLQHEAEELRNNEDFSVRAAAEINRAACVVTLEAVSKQPSNDQPKPI